MTETLTRIGIRTGPRQTQTVRRETLGGIAVAFRFRYVLDSDRWVFWILTADLETTLAGPHWILGGHDFLAQHQHDPRLPRGNLFWYSPDREPPTWDTVDDDASGLFWRAPS